MNTKFFFLLLVSLLISISTASISNANHVSKDAQTNQTEKAKQVKDPSGQEPVSWTNSFHTEDKENSKDHKPADDDGKIHHIHFTRIRSTKKRRFILVISKVFLAIIHICGFIYCFMHVFQ